MSQNNMKRSIPALFFLSFFICVNGEHFVLVHGVLHGAWCWYKVANHLKLAGHNVTALDMAASGINPVKMQEIHSYSEYHEPLITFMDSLPPNERVVLVGHSAGGVSVSVAMEKFPQKVSVAVFVAASVLSENLTYTDIHEEGARRPGLVQNPVFINDGPNKAPKLSPSGVEIIASHYYQLSPFEDLTLAITLLRPFPEFITKHVESVTNETLVTKEKNGSVSKVYIISEKDNLLLKDFQMWMIERSGPYDEVKMMKGSDHMVMFSKSKELSYELVQIAYKHSLNSIYSSKSINL